MGKTFNCPISSNFNMSNVIEAAKLQLQAQGYEVVANPMGEGGGAMTVSKDDDGFKKFMGLGVSCSVQFTVMNGTLVVNIESDWTNKIIALVVGWFLCWVPIITGIIGCVNQNDLPKKITTAVQSACANY